MGRAGSIPAPTTNQFSMEYLPLAVALFIAASSSAFVVLSNRRSKTEGAYTTIRLGRLLHYRDKAKALDQYMNKKIDANQLISRYHKIEQDKKRWKDATRNH